MTERSPKDHRKFTEKSPKGHRQVTDRSPKGQVVELPTDGQYMGTDMQTSKHPNTQTDQYNDSAWPRGQGRVKIQAAKQLRQKSEFLAAAGLVNITFAMTDDGPEL